MRPCLQSWLAVFVGGLLFLPTTIGALVWATSFLHGGKHMSMADAANDASMVPIGWVTGCSLLGYVSDRIGRREPVLIGGALIMLVAIYVPMGTLPRFSVAFVLGVASGSAMIPFSMMKEADPSEVKGTAAGEVNFLAFVTSGIMSPFISKLMVSTDAPLTLDKLRIAFMPLVAGVIIAIALSFLMRETGAPEPSVASRRKKVAVALPS